jgi:AAA+ ATPase superfamily predicted ATPase
MQKQVLGYESPLYGRRTGQIKLNPLSYQESKQFMPSYTHEDFLTIYGLTAGIPLYLTMMDDSISLTENIIHRVFDPNSFLYEEPGNLLMQELRTPNKYNDIIKAIATGSTGLNEIKSKTRIETNVLTSYVQNLIELNILEKKLPLTKIAKRKPLFRVSDGLFRFWYRYVPKYRSQIESGKIELIWNEIEKDLPAYTSIIFEELCRAWIIEMNGEKVLPFHISEVGAWWGNNPLIKNASSQAEEVDIIALGIDDSDLLVGECKWQNKLTDHGVIEKLIYRSSFFPYKNKRLILFSKSGYADSLIAFAKEEQLTLISFREMYQNA